MVGTGEWPNPGSRSRRRAWASCAAGAVALLLLSTGASAAVLLQKSSATFQWSPATGPVVGYQVQVYRDSGGWKDVGTTSHAGTTLTFPPGTTFRVRVAAFDANGNTGPWSPVSPAFQLPSAGPAPGSGESPSQPPAPNSVGAEVLWVSEHGNAATYWITRVGADGVVHLAGLTILPAGWQPVASGDFSGDHQSEIVWRDSETGHDAIWLLKNGHKTNEAFPHTVPDPDWQVAGTGDFYGNGLGEILWRNRRTGELAIWSMLGRVTVSGSLPDRFSDPDWRIVGTGDFNGDGVSEILWRNQRTGHDAIWSMDGATKTSDVSLERVADTSWHIVGTGDFDGDGVSEILWRNRHTGANALWFMKGAVTLRSPPLPAVGTAWEVIGTADFDGDGRTDILWHRNAGDQYIIWFMNGAEVRAARAVTWSGDPPRDIRAALVVRSQVTRDPANTAEIEEPAVDAPELSSAEK